MDHAKYRRLFLDESREHLGLLGRELLRLEGGGGGVDALFRAAHSIKGMAGSMGYGPIVEIAHALEDVLDRLRAGALGAQAPLAQLLFEGVDALAALVAEVGEHGEPRGDASAVAGRLREAAGTVAGAAAAVAPDGGARAKGAAGGAVPDLSPAQVARVAELARGGLAPWACRLRVSRDAASMPARNLVILSCLARCGTVAFSSPTAEEARAGSGREVVEAVLLTPFAEEQLRARLHSIPEVCELSLARLHVELPAQAPAAGGGEAVLTAAGPGAVERPGEPVAGLARRHAPERSTTVRVDTRVLDGLVDVVGELIVAQERLESVGRRLASRELDAALERLRPLVRGFRDTIMAVRMTPLELVTDRLPRLVRDVARATGKDVAFEVVGAGIEMDRAILEEVNDALVHLVRNAVDHGVEGPEARAAAGKGRRAMVRVRAGRERDWFRLTVEDDGRGMNPDRIAAAAVERGLVTAEAAAALTDGERLQLCCLPGLSTAGSVTDTSGRGVGMDVVKARAEACGGTLAIESRPGQGTAVTLRLPLTLAIVRILLVEAAGRTYGLPVAHVARTGALDREEAAWPGGRGRLRHAGRLVPLHDLGRLLGAPARDLGAARGLFVVVTESSGSAAAFAVERLIGTREAVVKPLGPPLERVRGLSGATVLGTGATVLVLDPAALA